MVELICTHCGGRLSVTEEKVILDEPCAELAQTLICDYCGCRYAMGDELPIATSVTIVQNLEIESVEGAMIGVSVGPDEDGSQVNIDQKMDVGVVKGMLVGAQIGTPTPGRLNVEQRVETVSGVVIGGIIIGPTASPVDLGLDTTTDATVSEPVSPADMPTPQPEELLPPSMTFQAQPMPVNPAPEAVNTWQGRQPVEPQAEPLPVKAKKKPWWQFWK